MSKNSAPQGAKYFKYTLTKGMTAIAIIVLILCLGGIVLSGYRLLRNGINEITDALTSPLLILVCIFCMALVISILCKSQYIVTKDSYVMQFGFIKSTYAIKDVTKVVYDTDTNKLTVFVGNEFSVLPLCKEWHEDFVQALRDVKPNIDYTFTASKTEE